jgi:pimeloyl-ACP methyl ester carboxylesterase
MLQSKIPTARILAFNYDSTWLSDAPRTRVELCGEELIQSLHRLRQESDRPIVFIAHSFGGLVVQDVSSVYFLLSASRIGKVKLTSASGSSIRPSRKAIPPHTTSHQRVYLPRNSLQRNQSTMGCGCGSKINALCWLTSPHTLTIGLRQPPAS